MPRDLYNAALLSLAKPTNNAYLALGQGLSTAALSYQDFLARKEDLKKQKLLQEQLNLENEKIQINNDFNKENNPLLLKSNELTNQSKKIENIYNEKSINDKLKYLRLNNENLNLNNQISYNQFSNDLSKQRAQKLFNELLSSKGINKESFNTAYNSAINIFDYQIENESNLAKKKILLKQKDDLLKNRQTLSDDFNKNLLVENNIANTNNNENKENYYLVQAVKTLKEDIANNYDKINSTTNKYIKEQLNKENKEKKNILLELANKQGNKNANVVNYISLYNNLPDDASKTEFRTTTTNIQENLKAIESVKAAQDFIEEQVINAGKMGQAGAGLKSFIKDTDFNKARRLLNQVRARVTELHGVSSKLKSAQDQINKLVPDLDNFGTTKDQVFNALNQLINYIEEDNITQKNTIKNKYGNEYLDFLNDLK